jgi:hypothetical protein
LACDKGGKIGILLVLLTGTAAAVLELIWSARFQSSAAKYMGFLLFWDVTQPIVVIPHRRFGTTHRSILQGSRITRKKPLVLDFCTLEDKTYKFSRNVGEELVITID